MKRILLSMLVMVFSFVAISQNPKKPNPYHIGVGLGYNPDLKEQTWVTLKFYTKRGNAFEFIGYNLHTAYRATVLFTPYFPVTRDGRLRILTGAGIHVGIWKDVYKTNSYTTNPIVGLDGIIGIEYRIPKIPISVQAHYQPSADLAGNNEYFYDTRCFGVTARFVF